MVDLSSSEMLFYGGIAVMVVAVVALLIALPVFKSTGKKINKQLEQEYGKLPK